MTSPFTFPPSVSFPMERFKFFIPPSYIFPPPFPPHYFGSTLFRPMQFPQFSALNNRKLQFRFFFFSKFSLKKYNEFLEKQQIS
uniref:Uncharacterized protein n=1 Tax=Onchocerca volvulus TaxID=6282 RepID=A0A8R1Y2U7_ONCVO